MMVRRDVVERLGGFDERLGVAFNDVDFCLRARAAGYLVVYTPFAVLFHYESTTRGVLHPPADEAVMKARWREALDRDPYYSPNLTREREDWSIRM
jgi:GT2 family glycosyltransferase